MVNQEVEWRCPDCGSTLGMVVGGELEPFNGNKIRTRGANLEIICSGCNYTKVWYTNDAVTKAVNQLISVISAEAAKSMIRQIGKAKREMNI